MEYRRFGPTDMTVSALGFGCWEMGGTYGDVTERDVSAAVNRAIDLSTASTQPRHMEAASPRFCWAVRWERGGRT